MAPRVPRPHHFYAAPGSNFGLKFLCGSGGFALSFFKSTTFNIRDGWTVFSSVALEPNHFGGAGAAARYGSVII
jgi:hypothetical protein